MPEFPSVFEQAALFLGRLDGRLVNSPALDIWLARARLKGAVAVAGLAGVPVTIDALQDWICGRTPPPRHSEGLNDPLSVAAVFHFVQAAGDAARDPIARATLNLARSLLDDRAEAALWAAEDLLRFGPLWRDSHARLTAPYPAADLRAVAERLILVRQTIAGPTTGGIIATAIDGRQFHLDPQTGDAGWILACHVPAALHAAGLTQRIIPSLVSLPRFLPDDPQRLAAQMADAFLRDARQGLAELDRLERTLQRLPAETRWTRRSKAPLLLRLELAYPGLRLPAIARLLGISHQGATKLAEQVRLYRDGLAG